jgi:hypothetical protein
MLNFEILAMGPYGPSALDVRYTPDSLIVRDACMEAMIDALWHARKAAVAAQGGAVFDGRLFRLGGFRQAGNRLAIELEDTSYREYIGTAARDFYCLYPQEFLAHPLAVCIALVTADAKLIVEKRRVIDPYRGEYHVIGGFLERDMDLDGTGRPDPFGAILREVREEIGVTLERENVVCAGLVRNRLIPHPELCFRASVSESFDEITGALHGRRIDQEIDELVGVDDTPEGLARFIMGVHDTIVATGEACLLLHGSHAFGPGWLEETTRALSLR